MAGMETQRFTIRIPAAILAAARKRAAKQGSDVSDYVRRLIAADLGKRLPEMKSGREMTSAEGRRMAELRHGAE
jgi:hypothetical protein